jgi:hypothetical protein
MKKRLRKKNRYDEFREWGRQLAVILNRKDGLNRLSGSNSPPLAANVPNEDGSHTPLLAAG